MNEGLTHIERYQVMTPQQRNAEMKQLFGLLPDSDAIFDEDIMGGLDIFANARTVRDVAERRKKFPLKQVLVARLDNLLYFAVVTNSFKSFIVDRFDHGFDVGMSKSPSESVGSELSEFDWHARLLQWEDSENGGIFDKNIAKGIESNAYGSEAKQRLAFLHIDETIEKAALRVDVEETLRKEMGVSYIQEALGQDQKEIEFIRHWRAEFIGRYGDEP